MKEDYGRICIVTRKGGERMYQNPRENDRVVYREDIEKAFFSYKSH